jgi:recombination protein RecR
MHKLPEPLQILVDQISRLPGLGPKSALRCALALLKWPEAETRRLGQSIRDLRDNLHLCAACGSLAAANPCSICADPMRVKDILCLVSDWDSLLTLEEGNFYTGQYLILGGLLAPLDNIHPESLELERLRTRLRSGEVREVVLALGATVEADSTATYIKSLITREFPSLKVSRLAQGIPLGAEVRFMDRETLRQSLKYRQEF